MSLPPLDNLVRIGQLKAEPRNAAECRRMLVLANTHLKDAQLTGASREGRSALVAELLDDVQKLVQGS